MDAAVGDLRRALEPVQRRELHFLRRLVSAEVRDSDDSALPLSVTAERARKLAWNKERSLRPRLGKFALRPSDLWGEFEKKLRDLQRNS